MKNGYGFDPRNLKKLVEDSDLTFAQIEEESGIPKKTLSRCLHGFLEPNMNTAVMLANYFGVSVDCIIGRIDFSSLDKVGLDESRISERLALVSIVEAMKYRRDRVIIELGKMLERANEICEMLGQS